MSHVADGELHAWLDGALGHESPEEAGRVAAHLKGCGDCRARLEEARELRERAGEILGGAAPAPGGLPPFEELEARAAARGDADEAPGGPGRGLRRPSVGPLRALAWAASLLLGVGLGWTARTVWQGEDGVGGGLVVAERTRAPESAAREDRSADAGGAVAPADAGARADRSAESRSRPLASETGETPKERVSAGRVPVAPAAVAPGEAAPEEPDRDVAAGEVWIPAAAEDAARWIGGRLLVVDGLPVVDVAVSTADGARTARARQRLPSGELVEVHQRPAAGPAAERDEAPSPAAARRETAAEETVAEETAVGKTTARRAAAREAGEASASVDGLVVLVRAPVAPDSLRVLLSRLRPREP